MTCALNVIINSSQCRNFFFSSLPLGAVPLDSDFPQGHLHLQQWRGWGWVEFWTESRAHFFCNFPFVLLQIATAITRIFGLHRYFWIGFFWSPLLSTRSVRFQSAISGPLPLLWLLINNCADIPAALPFIFRRPSGCRGSPSTCYNVAGFIEAAAHWEMSSCDEIRQLIMISASFVQVGFKKYTWKSLTITGYGFDLCWVSAHIPSSQPR